MAGFEPGVRGLALVGGGLGLGMVFLAEMRICGRGIVQDWISSYAEVVAFESGSPRRIKLV